MIQTKTYEIEAKSRALADFTEKLFGLNDNLYGDLLRSGFRYIGKTNISMLDELITVSRKSEGRFVTTLDKAILLNTKEIYNGEVEIFPTRDFGNFAEIIRKEIGNFFLERWIARK